MRIIRLRSAVEVVIAATVLCVAVVSASAIALGATILFAPQVVAYTTAEPSSISVTAVFPNGEPQMPELSSKAALVVDADTGEVVFSKNPDGRLPMASTTKIMTAILVLETLDLDEKVLVSRNAHFQSGSKVGLYTLDTFTVEQLLYWMLVFSGNDAAVALAEKTAGTVDKFVAKMNAKAKEMGLTNTHFTNANGLTVPITTHPAPISPLWPVTP